MKLYLLTNPGTTVAYDVLVAMVVAAETPTKARRTPPSGSVVYDPKTKKFSRSYGSWPVDPATIHCKLLGEASPAIKAGIICSDFHNG